VPFVSTVSAEVRLVHPPRTLGVELVPLRLQPPEVLGVLGHLDFQLSDARAVIAGQAALLGGGWRKRRHGRGGRHAV